MFYLCLAFVRLLKLQREASKCRHYRNLSIVYSASVICNSYLYSCCLHISYFWYDGFFELCSEKEKGYCYNKNGIIHTSISKSSYS
jgi:hypothetical protein